MTTYFIQALILEYFDHMVTMAIKILPQHKKDNEFDRTITHLLVTEKHAL